MAPTAEDRIVELKGDRRRWYLWLVLAVLALATAVWASPYLFDFQTRAECRNRYAAAKTAADTTQIDEFIPMVTRRQAVSPISCGMLRKQGTVVKN